MYYFLVHIVILLYEFSNVSCFFHFTHQDFLFKNAESYNISNLQSNLESWFIVPVDHFNKSDVRTFKMKYFCILDSWKPGGPILVYINGEAPLKTTTLVGTYLSNNGGEDQSIIGQIVRETGAAYIMLEHRYYGQSLPFDDITTEKLAYLSSEQSLADKALFLQNFKSKPKFKNSKVMVVGGSYAGNLAVWMKRLYPNLVDAVLASSAPVLAKPDFYEYLETVTDTFRAYGTPDCVHKANEKFNRIHELLQSSEGIEKLKAEYYICKDVDMTVLENQHVFVLMQINYFSAQAQYETPTEVMKYCHNFNFNLSLLTDKFPFIRGDCIDYGYIRFLEYFSSGDPQSWLYQTCTEFGYFQSTTSSKQMFGNNPVPVDFYYKTCRDSFGEQFNEQRVNQGVIDTNKRYGGLTPNVSHVVFTNGDMDPWHRLAVLQDLSADAPAIYITGSSHCHDLANPSDDDKENLREARKIIKSLMKLWIGAA